MIINTNVKKFWPLTFGSGPSKRSKKIGFTIVLIETPLALGSVVGLAISEEGEKIEDFVILTISNHEP